MNAQQTATLIIRLLGLFWFIAVLGQIGAVTMVLGNGLPRASTAYYLLLFGVQLCGSALLWLWPASLAARLLPSAFSGQPRPSSSPRQWQTIGVVCIGLWTLAAALPETVRWLILWRAAANADLSNAFGPGQQAGVGSTVARIAIGLWLTLGGKGISAALFRVRTAGLGLGRAEAGEDRPG
jgi:hypothetical protein